jgi:hypothetical protein
MASFIHSKRVKTSTEVTGSASWAAAIPIGQKAAAT